MGAYLPTEYLIEPAAMGRGFRELVTGTTPVAGASFTQALEGRYITRLLAVHCRLVTDGNAANREVVLQYRNDAAVVFAQHGAPTVVTASTTVDYGFNIHQGQADWPINSAILVPLSSLFLPAGFDFRLLIVNVQAGDALSAIRIYWERFWTDEAH